MADFQEARILLVEDDEIFADEFASLLASAGYDVRSIGALDRMLEEVDGFDPDLVLLDQFVRGQDSLLRVTDLRSRYPGPVVFVTSNNDESDRILGLELGADDFIMKLQKPREMLARIRAVLRRSRSGADHGSDERAGGQAGVPQDDGAGHGVWVNDPMARSIRAPDETVLSLTSIEYDCLVYLAARRGQKVARDELFTAVLRRMAGRSHDRTIDNLISRLRRLLSPYLGGTNPIQSVRGSGYVFVGFDLVGARVN